MDTSSNKYELIWPGKYTADKKRNVPSPPQTLPAVQCVEKHPSSGDIENPTGFFVYGDNLQAMFTCLKNYRNKVRLIYIDPPFDVGAVFSSEALIGDCGERKKITIDYTDKWGDGNNSYAQFMFERLHLAKEFLTPDGTIYIHCDYRSNALLRYICSDVFGCKNFRNEIIWHYNSGPRTTSDFGRRHDTILRYSVSDNYYFDSDSVREPYSPDINVPESKAHYYHPDGKVPGDVWDVKIISQNDKRERAGYATQKPLQLIERIIAASSEPGDIVADFFAGSGTTALAARKLGREWLACDNSIQSLNVSRKRLSLQRGEAFWIYKLDNNKTISAINGKLETGVERDNLGRIVSIQLTDYLPSKEVLQVVGKRNNMFDYVDSWAIDFSYDPKDPFKCHWSSNRTRKNPKLPLICYTANIGVRCAEQICVRAIDVLGQEYRTVIYNTTDSE